MDRMRALARLVESSSVPAGGRETLRLHLAELAVGLPLVEWNIPPWELAEFRASYPEPPFKHRARVERVGRVWFVRCPGADSRAFLDWTSAVQYADDHGRLHASTLAAPSVCCPGDDV